MKSDSDSQHKKLSDNGVVEIYKDELTTIKIINELKQARKEQCEEYLQEIDIKDKLAHVKINQAIWYLERILDYERTIDGIKNVLMR